MASHISMMDDVLISQLPVSMVRAALRHLVSSCHKGSPLLSESVKRQFASITDPLPSPSALFPGPDAVSPPLKEFMVLTRCLFSAHATEGCLGYLTHLFSAIPASQATWHAGSDLAGAFDGLSGDVIQAMQSIKESTQQPALALLKSLNGLLQAMAGCITYCTERQLHYPFQRATLQTLDAVDLLFPGKFAGDRALLEALAQEKEISVSNDQINGLYIENTSLGRLSVPRLFNGLWQMSSPTAWGSAPSDKLDAHLLDAVMAGFTATDMADHYGDAELIYGSFRNRLPQDVGSRVIAATKWCVFKPLGRDVTPELVLEAVRERCRRLGGRADLLQLHWQDQSNLDYLKAVEYLVKMTSTHPELVSEVGLVNFDAPTTEKVCEYMLEKTGHVGIVSNQVQFSLIDSRPNYALGQVCAKYGLQMLTYGSYCGGFLSGRWVGKASPDLYSAASVLTPSQRKYFDMIIEWGSWEEFQQLLTVLKEVADKHKVDVSNVAARWVLQQTAVGIVIVGTRLGVSSNVDSNLKTFFFELDSDDIQRIEGVASRSKGQALFDRIGDCGAEYR